MQYTYHYTSPLGGIFLACDDEGLTGLWFEGQKYFAHDLDNVHEERMTPIFENAIKWLDIYFAGKCPEFTPPLHIAGSDFYLKVMDILLKIPYGEVRTYGCIAKEIADGCSAAKMSAQAVGGAVGRNNISIIIPCHRVIGANGKMTGYAGGIDKKIKLLELERAYKEREVKP